jgi:hypothetical protein
MVKCSKAEVRRPKNCAAMEDTGRAAPTHADVLLRESGMTQPAIAAAMGVSLSTVNRAHMAYDHGGIDIQFLENNPIQSSFWVRFMCPKTRRNWLRLPLVRFHPGSSCPQQPP